MAYEDRRPLFNVSGELEVGVSALDTVISSTAFTGLPTYFSSQVYLPLTLTDAAGNAERVFGVSHASGSKALTVIRGREGDTARPFQAGDRVRCTPTPTDTRKVTGHAGQVAPTQQTLPNSTSGVVVQLAAAATDLLGGMTFANYGLVVPDDAQYLCHARLYVAAGANATNVQAAVRKNGTATNLLDGRLNKRATDAYDDTVEFDGLLRLAAGDRLNLWGRTLGGYAGSSYGADGYGGSFLEIVKVA